MQTEAFRIYFNSSRMKTLAKSNSKQFITLVHKNYALQMKLFVNLQHYKPSQKRTAFFNQKCMSAETLLFAKKCYCDMFISNTPETANFRELLQVILNDLAVTMRSDVMMAHSVLGRALEKTRFY